MCSRPYLNKIKNYWLLLLLIVLFHTVNNYVVLSLDDSLPIYDETDHLRESFYNLEFLKNLKKEVFSLEKIKNQYCNLGYTYRPPLYRLTLILPYAIFQKNIMGNIDTITIIANLFYFIILLISTYGIGLELSNSLTGIFAAFIVTMFPGIFAMSRVFMVDFPLTAMVSFSIYSMLLTKNFTNRKYSFLFGLSMGLGMLSKATYPIFLLPLLGYYIILSIIETSRKGRKLVTVSSNLIISFLIALFLSASWYLPNLYKVIQRSKAMSFQIHSEPIKSFISYYMNSLFSYHIGPLFSILCLISLFCCFRKKEGILLGLWLLIPLLIFSLSPNKNPRFILPVLPSIGLIVAFGVSLVRLRLIKKIIISYTIIFSLFSFFAISYGKVKLYPKEDKDFFYSEERINKGIIYPLYNIDWKIEDIGKIILSNIEKRENKDWIDILSIFNIGEIHSVLGLYLLSRSINVRLICPAQADFFDSLPKNTFHDLFFCDFVITKDGYMGSNAGNISWIETLSELFARDKDCLYLLGSIAGLPDGSNIYVYKNKCLEN